MLGLNACNFGLGLYCGRFCVFVFGIWLFVICYCGFCANSLAYVGRCWLVFVGLLVDLVLWFSGML